MEELKTRFLATHHGYFFPEGSNIPITSKGNVDADTFLIYIINEGTNLINKYNIHDLVREALPEMKDIIYRGMLRIPYDSINKVKPKHPKLFIPQSNISVDERLQIAITYYNECKKSVQDVNKKVLETINMGFHQTKESIIEHIQSKVSITLDEEEIEAVIMHINPKDKTFRKNTLLALKVLNRFAREQEIRFEDAVTVFSEEIEKNML